MNDMLRLQVLAEARSDLLCRLLGLLAQLDLPAPSMVVMVDNGTMQVDMTIEPFGSSLVAVVKSKMARFVGVTAVTMGELPGE